MNTQTRALPLQPPPNLLQLLIGDLGLDDAHYFEGAVASALGAEVDLAQEAHVRRRVEVLLQAVEQLDAVVGFGKEDLDAFFEFLIAEEEAAAVGVGHVKFFQSLAQQHEQ